MTKRKFFYDTEFMENGYGQLELISIGIVDETGKKLYYACNKDADLTKANDWVKENVIPKLPVKGSNYWCTVNQIRKGILKFIKPSKVDPVELWGYYSSYDHVLFCWIFGRMIDLPPGMPMLTFDIKQLAETFGNPELPPKPEEEHNALADAMWTRKAFLFLQEKMWAKPGEEKLYEDIEDLYVLWYTIGLDDDSNLTDSARAMKQKLLSLAEEFDKHVKAYEFPGKRIHPHQTCLECKKPESVYYEGDRGVCVICKINKVGEMKRKESFLRSLSKFLGGNNQVRMSIGLQVGGELGSVAKIWSEMRGHSALGGYPSEEETYLIIKEFLG